MTYVPPYIDELGIHIPLYSEVRDNLIDIYKSIYGEDVYLGIDTQDYQFISSFATALNDTHQMLVKAYNNNSPASAVGAGLDRLVALNGISRKASQFSTATVTITGTAGTIINNGVVADINNINWRLPASVTILGDGTVDVTATCSIGGVISANAHEINIIVTPTYGWLSVTNETPATVGEALETDASLRERQFQSVSAPSQTLFDGVVAAVEAVAGVTRCKGYENDESTTTTLGLPPNSMSLVVEGGVDADVAQAIYLHKSLGCNTKGDIIPAIGDTVSPTIVPIERPDGSTCEIGIFRPDDVPLEIEVELTKLKNYSSVIVDVVKANLVEYISNLAIGESVYLPNLYQPIYAAITDQKNPTFACTDLTISGTTDSPVEIKITEVASLVVGDITVTEV